VSDRNAASDKPETRLGVTDRNMGNPYASASSVDLRPAMPASYLVFYCVTHFVIAILCVGVSIVDALRLRVVSYEQMQIACFAAGITFPMLPVGMGVAAVLFYRGCKNRGFTMGLAVLECNATVIHLIALALGYR